MKTFIQACVDGEAKPDDIDDWIDRWHDGEGDGMRLAEFLGMTDDLYRKWAMSPRTGIDDVLMLIERLLEHQNPNHRKDS